MHLTSEVRDHLETPYHHNSVLQSIQSETEPWGNVASPWKVSTLQSHNRLSLLQKVPISVAYHNKAHFFALLLDSVVTGAGDSSHRMFHQVAPPMDFQSSGRDFTLFSFSPSSLIPPSFSTCTNMYANTSIFVWCSEFLNLFYLTVSLKCHWNFLWL